MLCFTARLCDRNLALLALASDIGNTLANYDTVLSFHIQERESSWRNFYQSGCQSST
jgi:hypothetical protein